MEPSMLMSLAGSSSGGGGGGAFEKAGQVGANYAGAAMSLAELMLSDKPVKPDLEDPEQRQRLNSLIRENRSRYTGSYAAEAQDRLSGQLASITEGIKSSSGSSGAMLSAMLSSSGNAAEGFNKVLSNVENQALQREGLISKLMSDISQRKLELQMVDYLEDKATREQAMSSLKSNLMGAMSMGSAGGGEGGGSSNANTQNMLSQLLNNMTNQQNSPMPSYKIAPNVPPYAQDPIAPSSDRLNKNIQGFGSSDIMQGAGGGNISQLM